MPSDKLSAKNNRGRLLQDCAYDGTIVLTLIHIRQSRAVASLQHRDHVVQHASRVLLVTESSSPAELHRSNERGVDQDSVSNSRSTADRQINLPASTVWAGTSLSNQAICPKIRRAARMSLRCVRPVRARTLMLLTKSNQRIPSTVTGISCGKPLMLSCLLQEESTFQQKSGGADVAVAITMCVIIFTAVDSAWSGQQQLSSNN